MSGINWQEIATQLGFPGPKAMWADFYTTRKMSLVQLSKRFSVSANVVRNALISNEVPLRGQGGPNNRKVFDVEAVRIAVNARGVASVAREMKVDPSALYKQLYYKKGLKKRPPEPAGTADATVDPKPEPSPDANQ
jgi:hypothetical protein